LALTQTQLATAVADRAEITKADAKRVLGALEEIVLEELDNAQKVRVGGLVQLKRSGRRPVKGRPGRAERSEPRSGPLYGTAARSYTVSPAPPPIRGGSIGCVGPLQGRRTA
jgi:DNA-binding protein HU-beta